MTSYRNALFILRTDIMKRFLLILMAVICAGTAFGAGKPKEAPVHKLLTANVRITGLEADEKPGLRWSDRREACVEAILREKPDIIFTQEMIYESYRDLKKAFKGYAAFGFEGPEMDPYTDGYHYIGKNVIFYNTKRYEMVGGGTYWFSDTPLMGGSNAWESARARHCNYLRLVDRKTGKQFRVLDVHLDHISDKARGEQAKLIVEETGQYAADFPQIMCGDFNSGIKDIPYALFTAAGWKEMWETVNGHKEYGFTAHAFKGAQYKPKKTSRRIDFMYYRGDIEVLSSRVIDEKVKGVYPSDHYFVVSEIRIK